MTQRPAAVDLFCGLGGWAEGLLAEGWKVIGFDIEQHEYGEHRYPGKLVIQDVLLLHGSWFKGADLIVASPPCQEYSYMAMPWTRAKAKAAAIRADDTGAERARLTLLFRECFRIQREACEAAGRHIPMIVENVRGAQPWVGKAAGKYGSFYLWGDVPALPETSRGSKAPGFRFDGSGKSFQSESVKVSGLNFSNYGKPGYKAQAFNTTAQQRLLSGLKLKDQDGCERNHPDAFGRKTPRTTSKGKARKMASAMIAKIPLPLSQHIARTFKP